MAHQEMRDGLDALSALRRVEPDMTQDLIELSERPRRVAELQRPCLAQMARTSSSEANSRRDACERD